MKNAKSKKAKQSHQPDLVVNCEALREGSEPVSIAFEIELTAKNRGETASILRSFKEDETRYAQIVWVVQSEDVRKHIKEEDQGIGMIETGRMKALPLLGVDGEPFTAPPGGCNLRRSMNAAPA
ncbi:hypothetical protein [Gulosibacter sp. 10]|uniref:hypothetical protein n=1 Tax=Gulosibacter sp. 10 TaxID=1255570 RepID=UPI00097EEF83|nr:hypothetical protein [Gulosibacter sp. 10]SJM69634.1 hypothetical protein FM112_14345 [Gulosibacter sp. 10]